jgi:hypothetical protein
MGRTLRPLWVLFDLELPWNRREGNATSSSPHWGIKSFGLRWFNSGARNHLQANRSLGFCFEILV